MSNLTNTNLLLESQENLDNIKYFLEKFEFSKDLSKLSYLFQKNLKIFSVKSVIPESYKKTRTPFNKMKAFHDISNCYIEGEAPIIFPKNPIILSEQCPLAKIKNNKLRSEKKILSKFNNKSFSIEIINNKKELYYGPYSIEEIYDFLNDIYVTMTEIEKKNYQITIVDLSVNIRYFPQQIYLKLKEEINKEIKDYSNIQEENNSNMKVNAIDSDLDKSF